MSSSKRRSTVHDLASLRIHPDGTRVSTSRNAKQRKDKHAGQDRHGNWVAQDAGGIGRVKTRRAAAKEAEKVSEEEEEEEEEERQSPVDKGKGKARDEESEEDEEAGGGRKSPRDSRAKRRKTFDEDMLLLGPSLSAVSRGSEPGSSSVAGSTRDPLLPGSDLLKHIHYFASTYYDAMGQLKDSSREFRREKKRRRLERLQKQANKQLSTSKSLSSSSDDDSSDDRSSSSSSGSEDESPKGKPRPAKRKRNTRRSASPGPDMYKVFDGSALVAIGMLLQHHVDEQLETNVPEGWEAAMEKVERSKVRRAGRPRKQQDEAIEEEVYDLQFSDEEDQKIMDINMPMLNRAGSDEEDEYIPD